MKFVIFTLKNRVWLTFYLSRDPHSRPMTYLMCACACVWVCTLMNLHVSKSRGRRRKEVVLTVLNSSSGKLGLSCLLRLLSVSLLQLLFLHCDSFKFSQSFLFLPTPPLHLFSLKMHVVLVCVPGWSQIYNPPVPCAGVVAMHYHAKCHTVDWLINRSIDLRYWRLNPGSHPWQDVALPLNYAWALLSHCYGHHLFSVLGPKKTAVSSGLRAFSHALLRQGVCVYDT